MEVISIIQRVATSHGDELSSAEALILFKKLPKSFDLSILENDMAEFENKLNILYPYLKMDTKELLNMELRVITTYIKNMMESLGIKERDLVGTVGLSLTSLRDFFDNYSGLSIHNVQTILNHFGLSLVTVERTRVIQSGIISIDNGENTPPIDDTTNESPTGEQVLNDTEGVGDNAETTEETTETTQETTTEGTAENTTQEQVPQPVEQ